MMNRNLLFVLALLAFSVSFAQVTREKFQSRKLNTTREIKIKLPAGYDPSSPLKHPVIVVFDGDYLFEAVAGQVAFQTYFDEMPKSIIVGIEQGKQRFYDSYYDEVTGMPIESGERFYRFVSEELLPYIDGKFNTSKFRVAVGHNVMGNFINSFLLSADPMFHAYVNLSPDFKGEMKENVVSRLKWIDEDIFYYMVTSDHDLSSLKGNIREVDANLKGAKNNSLTYYFDEFKGDTHYMLVTGGISKALDKIFELYKPLDEKELKEKVFPYEGTLDRYIVDRYERIEDLFGIYKPISEEEFEKIVQVAEERKDIESLEKIGKLANKQDPNSSLGTYYLALYAEKIGKTKKAVKLYESALELNEMAHIDKDFILSKVEDLKFAAEEVEEEADN
ncbi:alpha/beta hydrolase-fold protein [Mangrovimonas sp. YM274]|uniref:alpha/beta hydrolase-fold protein n=1 Tax=Mangrovimonas sp. YM274 TaxID=3070660 RepID=UPI0027DDCA6D|nr:alpha/beta hydrolase-fold protein [Mangrovimonas sp. YM274]WMI69249.1 alpha/beta hydrolase-fold protein [Mangrovimonas sp. YM274]